MSDWDDIKTDFGGDETANFGPRKETGSALYQIDTIATVSCNDQTNRKLPTTAACVLGDLTCLAVDKSLVLQASSILKLDADIEEVEWSVDGSVIVMGVTGGMLFVLDTKTTDIVFSLNLIPQERHVDGHAFRRILFSGTSDLVILTADGQLIVQPDIHMLTEDGVNCDNMITDSVQMISTKSQHSDVRDMLVHGDYIYTLGSGESIVCKWNYKQGDIQLEEQAESLLCDDVGLIMGKMTTDGHYLFALDTKHQLTLWHTGMLTCIKQYKDMKIADMSLLETNTSQNNSLRDMKLVIITEPEDGTCYLKVQSLPDWETVYNLQLSPHSLLAKCNTFQDALYVSEFCSTNGSTDGVSTLRFRCLNETDPKTRLYRILQKNKFEEAEQFANLFQLDIELVHKVKANYLIDQISPWNVGKYTSDEVSQMVQQLWECLNTIVDDVHIVETCMRAALPSFSDTEKLLTYCKNRLDKSSGSKDQTVREKQRSMCSKLLEIQHRLMTFRLAYGEETFTGEKWEQFLHTDLLHESLKHMDRGQLDSGFIIWTRHQATWSGDKLSVELIQKILSTMHNTSTPTDLLAYLCTGLVPTVVREVPHAMVDIVDFVIEKTKNMETTDREQWPKSAIQFAEYTHVRLHDAITVILDDDTCMAKDNTNKTRVNGEDVISPLSTLIIKLKQLNDVLHKYKCRLSLAQFLQETKETIAFRMLDKVVALELISQTLERQIRPYMKEHGLNQDQIFSKYVKDLLERYGQVQSYVGETAWEAKAACIIDCITDVEQKIQGISAVIEWAPIPWSSRVDQMVQMGLKLKHIRVSRLKEQCQQVHVRKLLMKYGMKNMEVPQGGEAERLMYVMLSQDKPGCMEDALEVMASCGLSMNFDLYAFRMRQLIEADRLFEGIELLRSLPADLGVSVGKHIVRLTMVKLAHTITFTSVETVMNKKKTAFTEAAILILKHLQSKERDCLERDYLVDLEKLLIQLMALQVEFGQYISPDEYSDENTRLKIMFTFLKEFFITLKKSPQTASYAKVYRLASILKIPHTSIQGQMAIRSANNGDIDTAVQICGELFESNPTAETADTLIEVVRSFLDLQAEIDEDCENVDTGKLRLLPDVCYRLASQAVCICSPDKMCQYLELCKTCSLLQSVSQQCESGESTLSAQWGESTELHVDKEMFTELTLDVFQEDALIMNSTTILPMVAKYALRNPLLDDNTGEDTSDCPLVQLCNSVVPIVQHLRDNSHIQLALNFALHMLYTLLQYIQQQDMGLPFISQEEKECVEHRWKTFQDLDKTSQAMLKELVFSLVMKIFNGSKVDDQLAFMYLCNRPKREVMDIMMRLTKTAGQHYKKLKAIAGMGIALGEILHEANMIKSCEMLETNASWGYRLSKLKISFKDAILGPNSEKAKLLPSIAQNEAADTDLVIEFCRSFKLDENEGLLLYLDHLFVPPEELTSDVEYNKMAVIERAREAIGKIKNKDELICKIKQIYFRTSSYDYESLKFTLEVMQAHPSADTADVPVEKGLKLLEYLKVITRQDHPSEYEIEFKIGCDKKQSQIFMSSLPPESKTRLPLHPLLHGDPWKIITPELRKETVATWLHTAQLLNLSPDQICLTAVQTMVRVYTETVGTQDGGSDMSMWNWKPEQANHALLQDAEEVLQSMKCESSLACAKWMVSKLPLGSEKVLVLKDCVRLAELWLLSIPEDSGKREKAKMAYQKFLGHWRKMASSQALCLNGLGEVELLQHTDNPALLIQKLYEHPSITQIDPCSKPDIHSAASKIAEINNIGLEAIQHSLIEKWLQTGPKGQQDTDTTMTFSLENIKFSDTMVEERETDEQVNFKRLVHLLHREPTESNMAKLVVFALKPEGRDTVCCIQALRCLLYMYDENAMQKVCGKSLDDIRHLLHMMMYLSNLEKLHIKHTVDTFVACHKEGLVKGIWKNHSHEKNAVILVSCLCLDYEIHDFQLWNSVLQRLHSFGLMAQLEYVLLRLNTVPELWQIPAFPKMWYTIISTALMKVCSPMSKEQKDMCVYYFNQLIRCPVLKEIDGEGLSKMYQKLQLPACALGCLVITSCNNRETVKSLVLQHGREILDSVGSLGQQNGLNHGLAVKIEKTVYSEILECERFEDILGSPYQKQFVTFCVQRRTIDPLLVFAIKHNQLSEARMLVCVFVKAYTDISMKIDKYIDDDNDEDDDTTATMKAYMRMQGLEEYIPMLG